MVDSPFLYPNVTSIPGQGGLTSDRAGPKKQEGVKSDFDLVLDKSVDQKLKSDSGKGIGGAAEVAKTLGKDLSSVKQPLKFSAHATQRLQERKINLDAGTMMKVTDAIDKAEAKGLEDTLVLTNEAALIVNIPNRTVITAMDKGSLNGNIFTNIDGAVIVS